MAQKSAYLPVQKINYIKHHKALFLHHSHCCKLVIIIYQRNNADADPMLVTPIRWTSLTRLSKYKIVLHYFSTSRDQERQMKSRTRLSVVWDDD